MSCVGTRVKYIGGNCYIKNQKGIIIDDYDIKMVRVRFDTGEIYRLRKLNLIKLNESEDNNMAKLEGYKAVAVTKDNKVVNCDNVNCGQCLLYKTDDYGSYCDGNSLYRWAESEFVEKHTITSREKKFLDALLPKWNYIARDSNTNLYIYIQLNLHDLVNVGCSRMIVIFIK